MCFVESFSFSESCKSLNTHLPMTQTGPSTPTNEIFEYSVMTPSFEPTATPNELALELEGGYDPTINFEHMTGGDIVCIVVVSMVFFIPLIWCYYLWKDIDDDSDKTNKPIKSHTNSPIDESRSAKLSMQQKFAQMQNEKIKQYEENERCEIEQLWELKRLSIVEWNNADANVLFDVKSMSAATFERQQSDGADSIVGPKKGSSRYTMFVITVFLMIMAGSSNDFLGKLIYQMYPTTNHELDGIYALKGEYWITFALTFGSFLICSFAIFTRSARRSYVKMSMKLFAKICIPSVMDTIVTGGRYLGLVFLSAAVISIMKNGSQLLFLAILRRCFHKKKLLWSQWFGIFITSIGLMIVAFEKIVIKNKYDTSLTIQDNIIGMILMLFVGFLGALRNDFEEILLKNDHLEPDFLVGMSSVISLTVTAFIGVALFVVDPFDNIDIDNIDEVGQTIVSMPILIVCFVLFLFAMYGKDTMQMRMTALSSSLTRKLFQQIYPSGTWMLSLITFAITHKFVQNEVYGEQWEGSYSFLRLGGFCIVMIGNYFYIKGSSVFALCQKRSQK